MPGTATAGLLLKSNIPPPPAGAFFVRVMVQFANAPLDSAEGVQLSPDTWANALTVIAVDREDPLIDAEMVAV